MLKSPVSKVLFYVFILIGLFVAIDIIVAVKRFEYPSTHEAEIYVEIPAGASLKRTAEILDEAGAISDVRAFTIVIRILRSAGQIQAGEYLIPAKASMGQIFKQFKAGKVFDRSITFAEGLTSAQIIGVLEINQFLTGELGEMPYEGTLLPETYHFRKGETRQSVISRMESDMVKLLDDLWLNRPDDFPLDNIEDAVILASIVEKETAVADERPAVAAVFLNRLKTRMRLQSDPTVIYGITKGLPLGRGLFDGDLDKVTPFNTYRNHGLPPTPIANPGRASLKAVFFAPKSDYYYFVADGTGGHVFAKTLEQHNKNVRQWRRIKREKNK
jgi:UPF0755 protein